MDNLFTILAQTYFLLFLNRLKSLLHVYLHVINMLIFHSAVLLIFRSCHQMAALHKYESYHQMAASSPYHQMAETVTLR